MSTLAWLRTAAALIGGQFDAAEIGSGDAFDSVVLGQPLIQECVVGVEEIRERAVLAQHMDSKNMRVSVFIASRSSGPHSGNFSGSGLTTSRLRISSHWPAKLSAKARRAGRPACASPARRARRARELAGFRQT